MSSGQQRELEERYLRYRQSRSAEDLAEVAVAGRRLVSHFVRIYTGGNSEDALQAGMEGLLKSVRRYDPEIGAAFSTYAAHCVMGEIRHFVRKEASYYRPGCIKELQFKVDQYVEQVLKETEELPAIEEIAAALNVRKDGVVQAMRAGLVALDEVDLSKIRAEKHETFRLPIEDQLVLQQAFRKLNKLQQKVIFYLFYRDLTQVEAAEKLGISQRQVSRVLHKSLNELKKDFKQ
ncbi:MAG: sigma-70 family RNA polymerase sigma factor [Dethiobacter sp.]|jgi:RNA polymerase sigma-B factor|nr:sigma-70 family RNA polymerase sigma factor [Dethiobacter sp.]MCL4464039.1 sigma-70 family RNA polymerase sigma factor [Bacillota bacterium]MCL5993053.1 sigma-70 family RNA polymerase sigma factor [Bacillota bacterium]